VICRDFDVDAATALRDALEFVEGLRLQRILQVSDGPFQVHGDDKDSASSDLAK
jgi:hypothetical protein